MVGRLRDFAPPRIVPRVQATRAMISSNDMTRMLPASSPITTGPYLSSSDATASESELGSVETPPATSASAPLESEVVLADALDDTTRATDVLLGEAVEEITLAMELVLEVEFVSGGACGAPKPSSALISSSAPGICARILGSMTKGVMASAVDRDTRKSVHASLSLVVDNSWM